MQTLLPARAYYALDAAIGVLTGSACPNCGESARGNPVLLDRLRGLTTVRRCSSCLLIYRPVGFSGGILLDAYYSLLYTHAGVATDLTLAGNRAELSTRMRSEGKDRSALLREIQPPPARVCVLGCSWGYELIPLAASGYDVFGVELSRPRRRFGRTILGLEIFASTSDAARDRGSPDVLLSSHVLEHIPRLSTVLRLASEQLRPRVQVHVTPSVERYPSGEAGPAVVGREHPLGVTRAFWERTARDLDAALDFREVGQEAIAVLRRC